MSETFVPKKTSLQITKLAVEGGQSGERGASTCVILTGLIFLFERKQENIQYYISQFHIYKTEGGKVIIMNKIK